MSKTMRFCCAAAITAGAILSLNRCAFAQTSNGARAWLSAGTASLDLSDKIHYDPATGLFTLPTQNVTIDGGRFVIGSIGDTDPFLSYSFSATNNSATTVPFSLDLSIPISPAATAGSLLTSSLNYTLTDGTGNGVTLTPASTPYLSSLAQTATGNGIDLGTGSGAGIDIGTASSSPGITSFTGSGTSPFAFSTLGIHLGFTLTSGDSALITGSVTVTDAPPTVTPEPGSVALLLGLATTGAGFLLRRRPQRRVEAPHSAANKHSPVCRKRLPENTVVSKGPRSLHAKNSAEVFRFGSQ